MNVNFLFNDFTALLGVVTYLVTIIVTEFSKRKWRLNGTWTQIVSWVICILVVSVGKWFSLGVFVNLGWITTIVYGVVLALVANKTYDTPLLDTLLIKLGVKQVSGS